MTMPDSKSTLSSESGAFLISGSAPDDLQDHGVDYANFAAASKVSTTPNGATHHETRQPEPRNSNISLEGVTTRWVNIWQPMALALLAH